MNLSLKWRIQLWHALILGGVLAVLGVGFYYYERAHRLDQIDDQLFNHIFPMVGTLRMREGPGGRRSGPPRDGPRQARENETPTSRPEPIGEWVPRVMNPTGKVQRQRATGDFSHLAPPQRVFEEDWVPLGFYVRAEARGGGGPAFQSSNYPGLEMPSGFGRGYFLRLRDGRFREIYHEAGPFDVLIGTDLTVHQQGLARLKWQIAGGASMLFGFGMLVGSLLVSRAIRPLVEIEQVAGEIAEGELSRRIPSSSRSGAKELQQLTGNLNHAFEQLEALFDRQRRFTADASHELRTPLTALLAQIEHGLKRSRSEEEYARILEVCQRSGSRIRRITEQLIELSRYDSGRAEMDFEEISLEPMLVSLAEELTPYVEGRGHALHTDLVACELSCDPFRLEQVITNFVNNAVQHNERPVTVTLRSRLSDGECVIEVIDNGRGIRAENLDKLFDRFFRESASRTRENGSSNVGLGLAISQAIVKAHGGRVEVLSEPDVETVFRVALPLEGPRVDS